MDNALINAATFGHQEIVTLLLASSKVDPSALNYSALTRASRNGHSGIVEIMLRDSRVNSRNTIPAFLEAVNSGRTDIVKIFLNDPDVDPSAQNNAALILATRNGYQVIVEMLKND
ncbi:hypothetical protein HDV02_000577, partial [Globomyces sp. JEL0801]